VAPPSIRLATTVSKPKVEAGEFLNAPDAGACAEARDDVQFRSDLSAYAAGSRQNRINSGKSRATTTATQAATIFDDADSAPSPERRPIAHDLAYRRHGGENCSTIGRIALAVIQVPAQPGASARTRLPWSRVARRPQTGPKVLLNVGIPRQQNGQPVIAYCWQFSLWFLITASGLKTLRLSAMSCRLIPRRLLRRALLLGR
jgi:hypothetical protein